jgi:transcriptional regulator with XRE-family HTH domain
MQRMTFPELLEQKYLQWQSHQGKRKTLDEFAEYIGVGRPVLSNWLTGKRKPGIESLRLLSNKLGFEVYDVLGLPRPDEDLAFITQNWDNVSPEFRSKFREEVEEHLAHEEAKRVPKNRRARASS